MAKSIFPHNRYYKFRRKKEEFAKLVKEDKELLSKFGLVISSLDPGVSAHIEEFIESNENEKLFYPDFSTVNLDATTWWWLRPLLIELLKHREQQCLATNGNKEQ